MSGEGEAPGTGRDPGSLAKVLNPEEADDFRAESEALLGALRMWLAEFRDWEEVERREEDLDPLPPVDLHSVVAEMTALRGEVRLSSRGAKASREQLEEAASLLESGLDRTRNEFEVARADLRSSVENGLAELIKDRDRLREELHEAREKPLEQGLEALLDSLEALRRGEEATARARQALGWRSKLLPRQLFQGLLDGYGMGVRRIESTLRALGVVETSGRGGAFDPHSMRSVESEVRGDVPAGQVLEVVRPGYRRGERILRVAEVRVATSPEVDEGN